MHFQIPYYSYRERYDTKLLALYHALKDTITGGVLAYDSRIPSTRELAQLYGLSRGTANQVYEMLTSEGYVRSETGRGTFVSYRLSPGAAGTGPGMEAARTPSFRLSPWGERVQQISSREEDAALQPDPPAVIDFSRFAPDPGAFPREAWTRCLYAQVRELSSPAGPLRAHPAQGCLALREAIARYLRRARGMAVQPEHVAVTGGSMQALALLAQLLIGEGEAAVVETPAYTGTRRAIVAAGGRCTDAIVDAQGIVPADWDAKAAFVTPTRQFPTGAVLSLERRQALLRWAYEREAVIVEDDYDSEFRHRGKSLEPLKALDREERVVYVGSFTKTLLPGLRLGYAVLPPALAEPFARALAHYEPQPVHLLEQMGLAAFMASGEYERHLRRMKRIYSRKFHSLTQLLQSELSGLFDWVESDAGLHVFGWWRGTAESYAAYRRRCFAAGVKWAEVPVAASDGQWRQGLYLNFPHIPEEALREGVFRMKQAESGC
ncbi:PLP-dependent aminotransferase family protein [Paenibacillus allorhizosphaerae]|uniref:HTH-type transcriptional regulatory protein GabR n=1 Tax=Paenibacillus allorhizosphaerae TaxID=2849866 RepID=A0ABN7TMT3_9BACL|nr:PLP-dependent aminotransferase family protein [Paenibacillus allorhizosphaerae]CAG7647645.1 HTH-type transcriptional regulatory protein GabR [Paenibacillus allorhizosphaerae]